MFLACLAFIVSGCAFVVPKQDLSPDGLTTVESMIGSAQFQKENLPVRTLRIAVVADSAYKESEVRVAFAFASEHLENQLGIRLEIVHYAQRPLPYYSLNKTLSRLSSMCNELPPHDITVGATFPSLADPAENIEQPSVGGIASLLFKNIGLRTVWSVVIVHEVGHLLLGHPGHSAAGVMYYSAMTPYFTIADRRRILSRKHIIPRSCPAPTEEERLYHGA